MIDQQIDEKYLIWQKMRLLGKFHGVCMDQYFGHMVHIFSLVIQLNPAKISFQLHFQSKIDVLINLMVNYDQIVFKIHVNIINLMKKLHILT